MIKDNMELVGHIWVYKNDILLVDQKNAIENSFKAKLRDNFNANSDFALDNLFPQDELKGASGSSANKDGICYIDVADSDLATTVTVVHPADASGNYYRQWQGVLTASGNVSVNGARLGHNLAAVINGTTSDFATKYASASFSTVALSLGDTLTINWKISF